MARAVASGSREAGTGRHRAPGTARLNRNGVASGDRAQAVNRAGSFASASPVNGPTTTRLLDASNGVSRQVMSPTLPRLALGHLEHEFAAGVPLLEHAMCFCGVVQIEHPVHEHADVARLEES